MSAVTTVIVGAGHAALAMSRCLAERSIDHVLLERGEVAQSWRAERWDSLRLLTPNWQSRLPGFTYTGSDPDGYRTLPEIVDFIAGYAKSISAPVRTHTTVTSVRSDGAGYLVRTNRGDWRCRTVVIASGACNTAKVPSFAVSVPPSVATLTAQSYRNPAQIADGGVLVVGASSSGTQIAHELQRSGRPVTLAVGEHIRAPRVYRGKDLEWWMDAAGVLDERYDQVDDVVRARRVPSLQLAGTPDRSTLDLNALSDIGVKLTGRLAGITQDGKAQFSGSLRNMCALSDFKMRRLLEFLDEWACANSLDGAVAPPDRLPPTRVEDAPPLGMDLVKSGIRTIIWASGYRPDYSWLELPVLDRKGYVTHDGGVVPAPGVYLMGMQFLRRRKSALIDGAGDDARDLSAHLAAYLDNAAQRMSA
ncbi:NAD(P)-binding domain-containing protein [Bradyrhizobium lablabi]|uniref:NAD(P)-binding domain-containing protein n=1 Tax=Bradyrhizobium lablabi TaxID=722472 RepID=UPI001BAD3A48|nr:NAD(P)-binding domain-containing protein [Bradyrhizobium lablabi]MBR0694265.1 NAD(P)-binding domain-containing protein [Bradyrhizobium lablabi]